MKALVIELNGREIERFILDRPSLFLGRSPSCDVVLRVKGLNPLHYLIEWVGEGEFNPNRGFWTLIDLSTERKDQARGEGIILSNAKTRVGKFTFSFTDDAWIEKEIQKGRLKGQVDKALTTDVSVTGGMGGYCLEVVSIRNDSDRVEDVTHTAFFTPRSSRWLFKAPYPVKFQWHENTRASLEFLPSSEKWDIKNRDEFLHEGPFSKVERVEITPRDVVVARSSEKQYYMRLVPKIRIQAHWKRDPFDPVLLALIAVLILTISLSRFVKSIPIKEAVKEPPRIVKVELPPPPPPPPVPEPEPPPEPKPEPPAAKIVDQPKPTPAPTPVVSAEPPKPKPKPEPAPSPAATVTAKPGLPKEAPPNKASKPGLPGVLGVLRKGTGGAKPLKADTLVADRPASELDTPTGVVAVARSNPGALVGSKNSGSPKGVDLNTVGTSLKGGYVTTPGSGGIEGKDSGTLGSGALAGAKSSDTGKGGMGASSGFTNQTEVEGGLDADAVRRAIREYSQQFRACYEKYLTSSQKKEQTGRVSLVWMIRPDGRVVNNSVASSSFGDKNLGLCIRAVVDKIVFPKAANGEPTRVRYPFIFQGKN